MDAFTTKGDFMKILVRRIKGALLTRRGATTLGIMVCLSIATMAPTCSKDQLTASAKDVLSALKDASPQIAQLLPGKAAAFAALIPKAEALVDAISKSDKTTALGLISDLGPSISQFAADLGGNQTVLAILAIANIALHFIVNHIAAVAPPARARQSPQMRMVIEFKNEETWGCKYVTDKRCTQ